MHEAPILSRGIEVIDEDPDPDTALRGLANVLQQNPRRFILRDDVVLNVERAFGVVGERDEACEGLVARGEQADAREIAPSGLGDQPAECSAADIMHRLAALLVHVSREARATGGGKAEHRDGQRG